jgi:hypothetical protein
LRDGKDAPHPGQESPWVVTDRRTLAGLPVGWPWAQSALHWQQQRSGRKAIRLGLNLTGVAAARPAFRPGGHLQIHGREGELGASRLLFAPANA